ncbi:hypothetical protein J4482_01610 [Candidatus Woesearchaeota archaeon]|nr:hypothetical protein [uncultured archaeon]AQS32112.1 hypothetical protein [uncultured archaeon]MBS3115305.1 hypothetical protein [Candidatus Woesearchaeota archaeon]
MYNVILMDACTAILLAKASVLESTARTFEVVLPKSVYEEVLAGKEKKFADALLTERLVQNKTIKVKDVENKKMRDMIKHDFGMGIGEADTITLAFEEDQMVATDNKQGRKAAYINTLKLIGSPEIVVALMKMGKISKDKAKQSLKILKNEGWFNDLLIEKTVEEIENVRN